MSDQKKNNDRHQYMAVTKPEICYDLQYEFHFSDINQFIH